jgi:hypothetical protein
MCALVFYFASRNHLKFKFELNSNEFVNYKGFGKLERFSLLYLALGQNPIAGLAWLPSLFSRADYCRGLASGPARPSCHRCPTWIPLTRAATQQPNPIAQIEQPPRLPLPTPRLTDLAATVATSSPHTRVISLMVVMHRFPTPSANRVRLELKNQKSILNRILKNPN